MRKASLTLLIIGVLLAIAVPASAQYPPPPAPTCETDKSVVSPGENVQVSGENWESNGEVQIRFRQGDLSEEYGPFPTDAEGDFSASITIPNEARDGQARIVVGGTVDGKRVSCRVQITVGGGGPPPEPGSTVCAIDDATPAPGQSVKVNGRHWLPQSEVGITFEQDGTTEPMGAARVNGAGRFAKHVVIPSSASDGPAEVVVRGQDAEGDAQTCRIDIVVTSAESESAGLSVASPANPANLGMLVLVAGAIALTRRRRTRALLAAE